MTARTFRALTEPEVEFQPGDLVSYCGRPMTVLWANNSWRGLWRVSAVSATPNDLGVINFGSCFKFIGRPEAGVA